MSDRIVIHANSNVSRGKFAAAAVHAALTAAGVHPGLPVIVLGAKPAEIERHTTVIRDAGLTEVVPGTVTAGTDWDPQAKAPATIDPQLDESCEAGCRHRCPACRMGLVSHLECDPQCESRRRADPSPSHVGGER